MSTYLKLSMKMILFPLMGLKLSYNLCNSHITPSIFIANDVECVLGMNKLNLHANTACNPENMVLKKQVHVNLIIHNCKIQINVHV